MSPLPAISTRLLRSLFFIDLTLVTLYLVNHVAGGPIWKLTQLLDLNNEDSLATWYSVCKLFTGGLLALLFALHILDRRNPRSLVVLSVPALFAALSLDEAIQIHEWLGRKSDALLPAGDRAASGLPGTGAWMVFLGIPFAIAFTFWLRWIRHHLPSASPFTRQMALGVGVLLSGALGFEALSNVAVPGSLAHTLLIAGEEGLEMIGASVMVSAGLVLASPYVDLGQQEERAYGPLRAGGPLKRAS